MGPCNMIYLRSIGLRWPVMLQIQCPGGYEVLRGITRICYCKCTQNHILHYSFKYWVGAILFACLLVADKFMLPSQHRQPPVRKPNLISGSIQAGSFPQGRLLTSGDFSRQYTVIEAEYDTAGLCKSCCRKWQLQLPITMGRCNAWSWGWLGYLEHKTLWKHTVQNGFHASCGSRTKIKCENG